MRRFPAAAALVLWPALSSSLLAATPAFVEATSERDEGKPQTSMWNAVDGNTGTMWCTQGPPGRKEAINFTFDESVVVTHLGIVLMGKDGVADKANKRPRIVHVADVEHRVEARFKDTSDLQVLELTPPARGTRVVVEFEDSYPGATDDAPLCIAEVVLRSKAKDITEGLGAKARGINTPSRKFLHQWHDDISAPSRTLIFNVDGTFQYRFAPLFGDEKPVKLKGKWSATSNSVTLDVGGKSYKLDTRFTTVESGGGDTMMLTISGNAPDPSMVNDFNPAPMLLP